MTNNILQFFRNALSNHAFSTFCFYFLFTLKKTRVFLPTGNSLLNFNRSSSSSASAGCAQRILHAALSKKLSNTVCSSAIVSSSFRGTPKKWPAVDTINDLRLSSTTIFFVNSRNFVYSCCERCRHGTITKFARNTDEVAVLVAW